MLILEIARSFYPSVGGLEKFLFDRFQMYAALKIDYDILATDFNTGKFDESKTNKNVRFVKQFTPYNVTPSIRKFLSTKYDFISVNQIGRFFSDYAIRWAKKNGVKIVLTPHFAFHTDKNKFIKNIIEKTIVKNGLNLSDAVICFTEVEKKYWLKLNPKIENKTHIIPHAFIPNEVMQNEINDDNYLLYVGRFEKNKRIDLLLQAFEKAKCNDLKLKLTIGVNELPKGLKHFTKNRNISFLGYVDNAEKVLLLKNCSALILPSDFEAFGIVLLEASNYYKPILCSNLEVFDDVLNSKGTIKFPNNVDGLANALNEFQELTLEQKREMGKINFQNLRRFDIKIIYKMYEVMFSQIF